MSDFGATLTLAKKNNQEVTAADEQLVTQELESFVGTSRFSNVLGEDFIYDIVRIINDNNILWVRLSEYWYGDGNNEESFEFAKENDLPQAEEIAAILSKSIGSIFDIKAGFENW